MMESETPEPTIKFRVSDMLARIDGKIDIIFNALAKKADKSDIDRLEQRLDGHEVRLVAVETWKRDTEIGEQAVRAERTARWTNRERVLAALVGVALAVGTLLAVFHP